MGFFDKKFCDVCGEKIGLLGNRKLEDGNLCKDCARKLSPWFSERRQSTVAEIKEQLAYREENERKFNGVQVSRRLGGKRSYDYTVYVDDQNRQFFVSNAKDYHGQNCDLIAFSQVTDASVDIDERKEEIFRTTPDGKEESFFPKQYRYYYDFNILIHVNSPWFSEIRFQLNSDEIEGQNSFEYNEYRQIADEIVRTVTGRGGQATFGNSVPGPGAYQAAPAMGSQWVCTCGAVNQGKFCTSCGRMQAQPRFRCDKCGWQPADANNLPRFCPQCGDPFDANDIQ